MVAGGGVGDPRVAPGVPPTKPSTPPRRGGQWPSRSPGPRVGVWGWGGGVLQRGGKGAGILVDLRAGPAWATGRSLGKENRNIQKPCPRTPLGDPVLGHPPDSAHQPPQPGPDLFLQSHQLSLARPPPDLRKDAGGRLPLGVRLPEMRKGVSTASGKDEAPPRSPPPEGWHKARGGLGLGCGPRGSFISWGATCLRSTGGSMGSPGCGSPVAPAEHRALGACTGAGEWKRHAPATRGCCLLGARHHFLSFEGGRGWAGAGAEGREGAEVGVQV